MMKVWHNPRCGKSRNSLKILEEKGTDYELFLYLKTPPTEADIKAVLNKLEMKPIELIRTNEKIYKEQYKGKQLSDDGWIKAMAENPILIERPIAILGNKAVVARPPERVLEIL